MNNALYITRDGRLRRHDNTLLLECSDESPRYIPVETVNEIFITGDVVMNRSLMELLTDKKIIMHVFSRMGNYEGTYYPQSSPHSGQMIIAQAMHWADEDKRRDLAVRFVSGAIRNMISVAEYYRRRREDEKIAGIVDGLRHIEAAAHSVPDVASLLGEEGSARSCYYSLFDRVVQEEGFALGKRMRRPPNNIMNALISFLNTCCYTAVLSQIYRTRLDPRISFLHAPSDKRLSLQLDIAEIFKPLIVDRLIFKLVNKRMIRTEHFQETDKGIRMTREGLKCVLGAWDERLNETIEHPYIDGRRISWRQLMLAEARKVQKHIAGECEYEPFCLK